MSITYKDVDMLNNAFGNLSQTLANNRINAWKQQQALAKATEEQTKEANTQAYRTAQTDAKTKQLTDEEAQRIITNKAVAYKMAEEVRHNKADEATAAGKQQTTLYTPSGERVTVPKSASDALKQNYAASNPGKQLSETNPFSKTLNVGGIPLTYHDEKSYNAAVMKQQQQRQAAQPKTSTRVTTGMSGGLPVNETNVTTTASSPMSGPAPQAQPPVIDSQQGYDALPKGAQYYDPQGNLRTKQ